MPDPRSTLGLRLDADLTVSFSGARGEASAHLHGGSDGMVLDVDRPAVLLGEARRQELPLLAVRQLIADTPIEVRTRGRNLARVRLTPAGNLRLRPTVLGLRTALQLAVASPRVKVAGLLGTAGLAATVFSHQLSRRRR